MPGAYARQPQGEHYDLLCHAVNVFKQDPTVGTFANLILLQGDKSKQKVEEFYIAGGFHAEFEVLKSKNKSPLLVNAILENWLSLLAIIYDPFDEDIPPLPLLTYFLCQRNSYYVDIHWCHSELTFMSDFIDATFKIITDEEQTHETRLLALGALTDTIVTFPPHRVTESAAAVFTTKNIRVLFTALDEICFTGEEVKRKWVPRVAELIFHIATFGTGITIGANLPVSQMIYVSVTTLLPGFRCTCGRCEFIRKLRKAVVWQNELGVSAATQFKRELCVHLIEAEIMLTLLKVMDFVKQQPYTKPKSFTVEPYDTNKDPACCYFAAIETTSDDPGQIALHYATMFLCYSQVAMSVNGGDKCLVMFDLYGHEVIQRLMEILVVRTKDAPLTQSLITCCCTICVLGSGIQEYMVEDDPPHGAVHAKKIYETIIRPNCVQILLNVCRYFMDQKNEWEPSSIQVLKVILAILYPVLSHQAPGKHRGEPLSAAIDEATATLVIDVCAKIRDKWKTSPIAMDERSACLCLLAICCYLVDGAALAKCRNKILKQFIPPPKPFAGLLLDIARDTLKRFTDDINMREETGSCLAIKALANITISRAEQAASIVPYIRDPNKPITSDLLLTPKLRGRATFATTA